MCNFAFLGTFFMIFTCSMGKKFLVTKGGSIKFFLGTKEGSIKCPAGGGIRTLPFRRGVTVPFPPMPTYGHRRYCTSLRYNPLPVVRPLPLTIIWLLYCRTFILLRWIGERAAVELRRGREASFMGRQNNSSSFCTVVLYILHLTTSN